MGDHPPIKVSFFQRAAFFLLGAVMYANLGILPQFSRTANHEFEYDNAVCVALSECGKFVISLGYLTEWGKQKSAVTFHWNTYTQIFLLFSVPAGLYAFSNNLDLHLALYMDAGTFQVIMQSKIVITSILWWLVFRKQLLARQWIAITLLAIGSAICSLQKVDSGKASMGVHDFRGVIFGALAVSCSSAAAIVTEFIYKRVSAETPIHVHNLAMYTWGVVINGGMYGYNRLHSPNTGSLSPLKGFNTFSWLITFNYIFLGLAMSVVMKYFSNITKLFINGASMYVSTLAAIFIFRLTPSLGFFQGLLLVTFSMALYNSEVVEQVLFPKKDYERIETKKHENREEGIELNTVDTKELNDSFSVHRQGDSPTVYGRKGSS